MANYTYTVTVASGDLYGGGTGNVFYLDGVRNSTGPGTLPWVNGGTLRLDQSDNTNDGHPLVFSTNTSTSGIISSGITYYLDGASNQANYTNTTTFNAATNRYIEITPASASDFYYLCYVHGIGMGGIFDITTSTWGALDWGDGIWGDASSSGAEVTGISASTTLGELLQAGPGEGWGANAWNEGAWGIAGSVLAGSQVLNSSVGDVTVDAKVEVGWGRGGWGNRVWGDTYSALAQGQSMSTSIGGVSVQVDFNAVQNGLDLLTITQGLNSIQVDGNVSVFVGEDALQSSLGTTALDQTTVEQVSGQSLSGSAGQVVAGLKTPVDLVGSVSATVSLGTITLVQTTTEVVSGQAMTTAMGSAVEIPGQQVGVGSLGVEPRVGSIASVVGNVNISLTGIGLTASIGAVKVTAWQEIEPGVNNSWTEVDLAA
tara:strand:+ start:448 stop:1734 length:1287 start_codon:yes stop_codon:yes gene_type:complete